MVSPNSSGDDGGPGSMERKGKRVKIAAPSHQVISSGSESKSDSGNRSGQKKPRPPPRNVASSSKSSVRKRPRDEGHSRRLEKNKKPMDVKKPPPSELKKPKEVILTPRLEAPKQNDKKASKGKQKVKVSDPSPKSGKKNGPVWDAHDEVVFLESVAAYQASKGGLPKTTLVPVYDYVRELNVLGNQYSNVQMYDKLRRLKLKSSDLKAKIDAGEYKFKNAHEETLYKLCRKILASGKEEEQSMDVEDDNNGDEGAEEAEKKSEGQDVEIMENNNENEEKEDKEEAEPVDREGNLAFKSARKKSKRSIMRKKRKLFFVDVFSSVIDVLRKDNSAILNELKEVKGQMRLMVREGLALRIAASTRTGCPLKFSCEEFIKTMSSSRELPALPREEAEILQNKWYSQTLLELDAAQRHLLLLQDECRQRLARLRTQVDVDEPSQRIILE